jgi:hypothetical protein
MPFFKEINKIHELIQYVRELFFLILLISIKLKGRIFFTNRNFNLVLICLETLKK